MNGSKNTKIKHIVMYDQDRKAIKQIKENNCLDSDSQAVRIAVRKYAKEVLQ